MTATATYDQNHGTGHRPRPRLDIGAIKDGLRIVEVVEAFVPGIKLKRQGRDLVGLSPFKAERTPSFTIDVRKNSFYCFATSEGGDPIRFVERLEGCDFMQALSRLRDAGLIAPHLMPDAPAEETAEQRAGRERRARDRQASELRQAKEEMAEAVRKIATAQQLWKHAGPAAGTLAETYLRTRGIDTDALARVYGWRVPPALRFVAALPYRWDGADSVHPAMVGAMALAPGQALTAVHRTYLAADGIGADGKGKAAVAKPKLMLGSAWGSLALLTPMMPHVVIGEGYETTLSIVSVKARLGQRICAISAGSLGNLAGAGLGRGPARPKAAGGGHYPSPVPDRARPGLVLPPGVKEVTILADNDGKDPTNTRLLIDRATAKFRAAGVVVRVAWPPAGTDFNDLIKGGRDGA